MGTPSPDSTGAVRMVRPESDTIPAAPALPRKPTMLEHPAVKTGGILGSAALILSMMIPVWQTWLDRGQEVAKLEMKIALLEVRIGAIEKEKKALDAENRALRKRLRK